MTKTHSKTDSFRFTNTRNTSMQNGKTKAFLAAYQFYIEKKESLE